MATSEFIGKYLSNELVTYLPGFQNLETPEYLGLDTTRNMVNIVNDLPIGQREIVYFTREDFGGTAIYDLNAEIPMVDYSISQEKIVSGLMFVAGAKWNIFDIEKYQLSRRNNSQIESRNPVALKTEIMREFLTETENNMVLYGASNRNCYGLFNQPDIPLDDQSALGSGNFYSLEPEEIYSYLIDWISAFRRQSKVSSKTQISIMVPERLETELSKPFNPGNGNPIQFNTTVWNALLNPANPNRVGGLYSVLESEGENLLAKGVMTDDTKDRIVFKANIKPTQNLTIHRHPRQILPPYQRSSIDYEVMSYSGMSSAYIINTDLMMYVDVGNPN